MNSELAGVLALRALGFLVGDEKALRTFMTQTGLTGDEMRAAAAEPGFQAGVLDFLLKHEDLLLSLCEHEEIDPKEMERAHRQLSGHEPERSI